MPNNITNVGFSDYAAEQEDIARRRAYAQALQQQGQQPMGPTETVGGWAVKQSPLSGLAKMLQAYGGRKGQEEATERQKALGERYKSDYQRMIDKGLGELHGTPAQENAAVDDPAAGQYAPASTTPAVPPNPRAALATFGTHPMGAQLAPIAMQQIQRQQLIQALRGGGAPSGMPGAAGTQPGAPTQAGGAIPGMGGPARGIPMEVWLQTDPSGKSYLEALAKQNDPLVGREGAPVLVRQPDGTFKPVFVAPKSEPGIQYQYGPQGAVTGATSVPGYGAAAAGITRAQEGAKADFDMVTVNTPQGPQLMTRAQAAQLAGGGAQQQPPPAPPQGGLQPGAMLPNGPGKALQITQPIPPQDMPAFNAARRGPGIQLQDQGSQRTEAEIGAGYGKRYNEIQDAGFAANKKINQAARLGSLLERLETGKLSPLGYEIAAYAASVGLPVSKNLPNAEAVKALANEMALEFRNPTGGAGMPGAMSDADRNYLQGLIANLDKTPGANKLLIEGMQKVAERERDIARIARDYKRKHGTFDDGFYDELDKFSKQNPLFGGPVAPPVVVSPETKAFMRSRGIQVDD